MLDQQKNAKETKDKLAKYVQERLLEVRVTHNLTVVRLAQIAGYERAAIHRMLRGGKLPKVEALYRISQELGIPMSFWFPDQSESAFKLPPTQLPECVCQEESPLTIDNIRAISQLSAIQKTQLRKLLRGSDDSLAVFLQLASLIQPLSVTERATVISGIEKFVAPRHRPASS